MPKDGFLGSEDTSSVERHFNRSLRIRLGVMDSLASLADLSETGEPIDFETLFDLACFAGNHIFNKGWDRRLASSEAAGRWVKQLTASNGLFALDETLRGGIVVRYREASSRGAVRRALKDYRFGRFPKRGKKRDA